MTSTTKDAVIVVDSFQTLFSLDRIDDLFKEHNITEANSIQFYNKIRQDIAIASGLGVISDWFALVATGKWRVKGPDSTKANLATDRCLEAMTQLSLSEGAFSFLTDARNEGISVHLASTCDQNSIDKLVDNCKIRHLLSGVHSAETVRCYPPGKKIMKYIADSEQVDTNKLIYVTHQAYDTYVAGENDLAAVLLLRGRSIPDWPSDTVRKPAFVEGLGDVLPLIAKR